MVMGSEEESLLLKWDKFDENVKQSFTEFQDKGYFFDVILACEDKEVKAHKLILSACSPFFKRLLLKKHVANNLHPLIYLRGVKADQLDAVLAFIYQGEVSIIIINIIRITSIIVSIIIIIIVKVNIKEEELDSFMLLAKDLDVKGLAALYNKEPSLFHQSLREDVERTKGDEVFKNQTEKHEKMVLPHQEYKEAKSEVDPYPLEIETDFVNEDVTTREDIVKELVYKGFFREDEELSSPQNRDSGVANIEGTGSVLHEESIKDILEEGTAMYKKEKQDRQNIETTQTGQGQKTLEHQNRDENDHNVVHSQKLKRRVSTDKATSKKVKSSQPKEDQNLEEDPYDTYFVTDEVKNKQSLQVNQEALKETMLKTWSRQVDDQEEELTNEKRSTEDDVDNNDSTEAESFQNLIHRDVIQRSVHKDKREALMERQDRTKHSKLTWICKVCGFKSTNQSHVKCHVETHIEGLEFVCDLCGKINKTTAAFAVHQHRCSKRLSLSNPNVSVRKNAPWEYDSYFREESSTDKPYKCNQ